MTPIVIALTHLFGALAAGVGEAAPGASSPWLTLATLFGAATVLAMAAVVLVLSWAPPAPDARGSATPPQNVELPVLVSQSNPAAPGHVRARAPGAGRTPARLVPAV